MTRVVVDAALRGKLRSLTHPVELCDEGGHVLGQFTPAPDLSQYDPDSLKPQVGEEELHRRSLSKERTYKTSEVLDYLEKL